MCVRFCGSGARIITQLTIRTTPLPRVAQQALAGRPKRVIGAYQYFLQKRKEYPEYAAQAGEANLAGAKAYALWQSLSCEQQSPFLELAAKDSARYKQQMDAWKNGPVGQQ